MVVVVDERSAQDKQPAHMPPECQEEMQKMMKDQETMQKAQKCEQTSGHAQAAVKFLEGADSKGAQAEVEKLFKECAGLSDMCAKQVAPDIVLKMRLSGAAVSEQCVSTARTLMQKEPTKEQQTCQETTMKGMVQNLEKQDLEGAMATAQKGLQDCNQVKHPCDFQLAPVLLLDLLSQGAAPGQQAEEQPEMELPPIQVLVGGMERVAKTSTDLAPSASVKSQAKGKAVSLLDVAARVRISTDARAFKLTRG